MAKKNTLAKGVGDTPAPKIIRSYDPMAMEERIYKLENGGGSTPTPSGGETYSETETEIGTWVDDKKIYRKVIESNLTSITAGTTATLCAKPTGLKDIIACRLVCVTSTYTANANPDSWVDGTDIKAKTIGGYTSITKLYVILDYTKTE